MKRLLTSTAALALLAALAPASAADLNNSGSAKDTAAVSVASPFAGFNISFGLGGSFLSDNSGGSETVLRGDVTGGYNWVASSGWLGGVYADVSLLNAEHAPDPIMGFGAGVKIGHTVGAATLIYAKAGWDSLSVEGARIDGVLIGGGADVLVARNWSVGIEADYVNYPNFGGFEDTRVLGRTSFHFN